MGHTCWSPLARAPWRKFLKASKLGGVRYLADGTQHLFALLDVARPVFSALIGLLAEPAPEFHEGVEGLAYFSAGLDRRLVHSHQTGLELSPPLFQCFYRRERSLNRR